MTPEAFCEAGSGSRATLVTDEKLNLRVNTLLQTIARDIHFWIPLIVLLGGLLLLRELH